MYQNRTSSNRLGNSSNIRFLLLLKYKEFQPPSNKFINIKNYNQTKERQANLFSSQVSSRHAQFAEASFPYIQESETQFQCLISSHSVCSSLDSLCVCVGNYCTGACQVSSELCIRLKIKVLLAVNAFTYQVAMFRLFTIQMCCNFNEEEEELCNGTIDLGTIALSMQKLWAYI